MTIKIKANDTFMDGRVGLLHSGETKMVSQSVANELEKAGFVTIVSGDVIPSNVDVNQESTESTETEETTSENDSGEGTDTGTDETKNIDNAPFNKMLNMFGRKNK